MEVNISHISGTVGDLFTKFSENSRYVFFSLGKVHLFSDIPKLQKYEVKKIRWDFFSTYIYIYIYITLKAFSFFIYTLFIMFRNVKILITKHLFIDELYFGFFQTFEGLIIEESSKVYRNITQGEVYVCLYVCLYVYMYICMYVYKYIT